MAGGSGGPPKLDGRNYAYWKARMAGYLEAINPIAWAVTEKPIVGPWNEDQVKYGARAKNALLMLLVRRFLLVFTAKRPLMKFGKHLKLSMLVLKNFVKKNIKCLRKNLMNSKCFQMSWLNVLI